MKQPRERVLTPHQRKVARLVCRGWMNKEIALELGISEQAVKNTLRITCAQFGIDNRTMLAVLCTTDADIKKQLEGGGSEGDSV